MVDKPPPEFRGLPELNDSMVENFQIAFNILKAGHLNVSFVYIWNAHYIILSLLGGALLSISIEAVSKMLSRRRMRRLGIAAALFKASVDNTDHPKQSTVSTNRPSSSLKPPAD